MWLRFGLGVRLRMRLGLGVRFRLACPQIHRVMMTWCDARLGRVTLCQRQARLQRKSCKHGMPDWLRVLES